MTDIAPLTRAEQIALDDCEQRIERGLKVFIEVGSALAFIRDNRLYRASHQTFEAYAKVRFNISRPRAYELITAAEVVSGIPDTLPAPTNAGQATELAKLPEADRADVWAEAVERTGGKPTAKAVSDVAKERSAPTPHPAAPAEPAEEPAPLTADERERLAVDVLSVLADSDSPYGMTVAEIWCRLSVRVHSSMVGPLLYELAREKRVFIASGTGTATRWAYNKVWVAPEDHPETGEVRSAGLTSADLAADESAGSVVDPGAADELPARACEVCGGPVDQDAIAAGFLRCEACDEDGDHVDRDGVCMGCNPPADEDEPTPAPRPPLLSPEEVRQIEAHGERVRAINHARRVAERFLTEVSGFVTDIEAGVLYGETGLFTEDMAAELRKQADRVERYLEGRQ